MDNKNIQRQISHNYMLIHEKLFVCPQNTRGFTLCTQSTKADTLHPPDQLIETKSPVCKNSKKKNQQIKTDIRVGWNGFTCLTLPFPSTLINSKEVQQLPIKIKIREKVAISMSKHPQCKHKGEKQS